MGPQTWIFARARLSGAAVLMLVAVTALLGSARPAGAQGGCTPVMGQATATPAQLAGWFATTARTPKLDVKVLDLATMFVEEGAREGVRGDLAFAQSIVETGYFGFSPSVPPDYHNYSGLGATGGSVKGAGFPDARTGVRAQIQHLRAYADPTLRSAADLKAPLVDPRFRYLVPNERTVPCWEQFGGGVWAADPTGYGPRVIAVHQRISAFRVPAVAAPAPVTPVAPVAPAVLAAAQPAAAAVAPAGPQVAAVVAGQASIDATAIVADLGAGPALTIATPLVQAEPPVAALDARVASSTSASAGGGSAGGFAAICVGLALLTICSTLWWHGRRFARAI